MIYIKSFAVYVDDLMTILHSMLAVSWSRAPDVLLSQQWFVQSIVRSEGSG